MKERRLRAWDLIEEEDGSTSLDVEYEGRGCPRPRLTAEGTAMGDERCDKCGLLGCQECVRALRADLVAARASLLEWQDRATKHSLEAIEYARRLDAARASEKAMGELLRDAAALAHAASLVTLDDNGRRQALALARRIDAAVVAPAEAQPMSKSMAKRVAILNGEPIPTDRISPTSERPTTTNNDGCPGPWNKACNAEAQPQATATGEEMRRIRCCKCSTDWPFDLPSGDARSQCRGGCSHFFSAQCCEYYSLYAEPMISPSDDSSSSRTFDECANCGHWRGGHQPLGCHQETETARGLLHCNCEGFIDP